MLVYKICEGQWTVLMVGVSWLILHMLSNEYAVIIMILKIEVISLPSTVPLMCHDWFRCVEICSLTMCVFPLSRPVKALESVKFV